MKISNAKDKVEQFTATSAVDFTDIHYITADKLNESDRQTSNKLCANILDELNGTAEYRTAEVFKFMIACGIYIFRNKQYRIEILPIVGRGYWTAAGYANFRQHFIDSGEYLPLVKILQDMNKKCVYFDSVSTK